MLWGTFWLVFVISVFSESDGQFIQIGQCGGFAEMPTFDIDSNTGMWFETLRSPYIGENPDCSQVTVERDDDNNITIYTTAVNRNFYQEHSGFVTVETGTSDLVLSITTSTGSQEIPVSIMMTDYVSLTLAYNCENISAFQRSVNIWVLGRTTYIPELFLAFINTTLVNNIGVTVAELREVDHSDDACYILPVIEEGDPIIIPGQCDPDLPVQQNFNAEWFLGEWQEIASYESDNAQGTCARAEYSSNDGSIYVLNSEVINQTLVTISGTASVISDDNSGKLLVTLEVAPGVFAEQELWVIETDYDQYAVLYSCIEVTNATKQVYSWILSRSRELPAAAQTAVDTVIDSIIDLNRQYYQETERSDDNCFYFPEPVLGQPVVFRGQCDQSIPVVEDFDISEYTGLWHDIESYPSIFQSGTCNNARYTLNGDVVDVLNTQVIDVTLDTITGTATAAEDGSARLTVTFPVAGTNETVSLNYWVIDTDYTGYSLVYSCFQLNEDQRQVWSWKLSRNKSLSAAAQASITNAIANITILDQRYYEEKDQSAEGCFYYPEVQSEEIIVFPGQCEDITVQQNFSFDAFSGTWYEVEKYPNPFEPNQCVRHEYDTTGDATSRNFTVTGVIDQFLYTSTRRVVSGNGDGQLIHIDEDDMWSNYYILATDYTDYAVAYNCWNVDSDYRRVMLWKLSRTPTLSTNAAEAINNATAGIQVSDQRYFLPVGHEDEDCFYLPDLELGEPVIIVGQCDPDIPVVQNFDVNRYSGRWRLIESYYADFQTGTCIDARYTLLPTNVVEVYNTQVVNQTLETITGTAVGAADGSGKLTVTFPESPVASEYWVLDTDYDNYAIVYSCVNINAQQRQVWSWKLSRNTTLSQEATAAINEVIDSVNVLNNRFYQAIDHTDDGCFYYPPHEPTTPVVFRGQCDPNITVVTDFDLYSFSFTWYDIESYPSVLQDGTCKEKIITFNNGAAQVTANRVINERLDTVIGSGTPSVDGSGQFSILFENNVTVNYSVIGTDYNSWALLYSCENVNEEYRTVSSWKLSRTKQLSATDAQSINAIVDSIPVLDERYYNVDDHSEEGCFYYPEPVLNEPVIFPGQCNPDVAVVENLDLSLLQGTWFEVQAYPEESKSWQCLSHEYTYENGSLSIESFNVDSQILQSTVSTAVSVDGSGRLVITNNNSVSRDFWIISTDYTDYVLAYRCEDITSDFRAVWSWKLSRTPQLSFDANIAINSTIDAVQVLDNRYYQESSSTDEDCFYLPDYIAGQPVVFVGQCDDTIAVVQNFDPERYSGYWRLIESYPTTFQTGTCNDATYTLLEDSTVNVFNTEVVNETLETINGSAVLATTDGSGKLLVTFPGVPVPADYWILDTDYDNYALVYSCSNLNENERVVYSWKLSRTREFTDTAVSAINSIVDSINVLDDRYYEVMDHSAEGCFYYPEADGNPVIFRGQCNENIPVVTNFDAVNYMDLWYDIESYPQVFQFGTCPTATYTLNDGVVDVYNTQVVSQELDVINGTATLEPSDDGSAKLWVTFPVAPFPSPYWVLATDYNNYALVYSCVNINPEYRSVSSWKLSRQPFLSEESQAAINTVANSVQVLRQQYYLPQNHTEEACFFYPNNNGGPVYLDGQCESEDDLPLIENFSLSNFAGTWFEESRFPSELQSGACATNEYSLLNQNTLGLTQTIVYNDTRSTFTGIAVSSPGGRGILRSALSNANGVTISMNLYILDTDYENFALVFNCRNLENDTKQIYSWKLSRSSAGLTDEANERIDAIVSREMDLHWRYYEPTAQTSDACFYYPEYDDSASNIVLPGVCEPVEVVTNFNIPLFLNQWFEVERYPTVRQSGACTRLDIISSSEPNGIIIQHSQVLNTLYTSYEVAATSVNNTGELAVSYIGSPDVSYPFDVALNVLATDYTSYALLYRCVELDNGYKRVMSSKWSRDTTLSEASNAAINNIIASNRDLLNDYYVTTSQSEESCFYIPQLVQNQAPLFRTSCPNVVGVANFDIDRYLGLWHEIERYPIDGDGGLCIRANYETLGTGYTVVDSRVFGLAGESETSTITTSADGRLIKTLPDGQLIDIWVLATDYETYSLLYSCEDLGNGYSRIWSAKHSRTRQLPQAAQDEIAPIIEDILVLTPQLYISVDQSDTACFHYPEPTGQQIILPGQCDTTITGETNFNVDMYSGIWYQIERYPQIHENGNCSGAQYTVDDEAGVVRVVNWEVVDGELDTIEGTATALSTDGRLSVTLPIVGTNLTVTTELHVLLTDYVSYSLVYSCNNIDEYWRSVGAWKLSRTRALTPEGNFDINVYMSTREEFHLPYFLSTGQNAECPVPDSSYMINSSIVVILLAFALHLLLSS